MKPRLVMTACVLGLIFLSGCLVKEADIGKEYVLTIHVFDQGTGTGIENATITLAFDFMKYVFGRTDGQGTFKDNLLLLGPEEEFEKNPYPKGTLTITAEGYETMEIPLRDQPVVNRVITVDAGLKPVKP